MSRIRALLIADPLIVLATIVLGTASLITSFFDSGGHRQIRIARFWSRLLLYVSGVKVRIEGIEKIPPGAACVIASNHASYMDTPVVLASIPVEFRFLAKHGLFQVPFLGFHLARAGHIPVYRGNPRQSVKTLSHAAQTIQERGISLLVFPEGGRSHDGVLRDFNDGASYIAIKAQAPLIPIALLGTREILPWGSGQPRRGTVILRIGDPIPTGTLTLHDRVHLTQQVRNQIVCLMETPNRG